MEQDAMQDPDDDTEIELKLEIDPGDIDAVARSAALAGLEPTILHHVSTYYDTPHQDLRRASVSLRVRSDGARHVQTIKAGGGTAAGLFARQEWECEIGSETLELSADSPIRTLIANDILDRVTAAFTVTIERRRWLIDAHGGTVELVVDTGVVTAGDRITPVSEIELELKSGAPSAIFGFVRALDRDLPLRLGVLTKGERGYALLGPAMLDAVKAEPLQLDADANVADAFAQIVAACLRHFRLNETILRRTPGPAALHQARVALRRLRSALSIFKSVVADRHFVALAAELNWLAGTLGAARDLDVLVGRLDGDMPAALPIAREAAYATALAALDSARARTLMIDLVEWSALGIWRTRPADPGAIERPATDFAGEMLDRLSRRVERRGRHLDRLDDAPRHRLRIAAKKLRYAVGFFGSLYTGGKARRRREAFLKPLEKLQDHLGTLNDLATAPVLAERLEIAWPGTAAQPDRDKILAKAARAHERLRDAKRFW